MQRCSGCCRSPLIFYLCVLCTLVVSFSLIHPLPRNFESDVRYPAARKFRADGFSVRRDGGQSFESNVLNMVGTTERISMPNLRQNLISSKASVQYKPVSRSPSDAGFLPWHESVAGSEFPLLYMPFMDWSLQQLLSQLDFEPTPMDRDLALKYSENQTKPGRIVSLTFNSSLIRKARLTYFDAGSAVQVFNMVLYPDTSIDAPIFGVDLIAFNKKHLAGIDFQPLYPDSIYSGKYIKPLSSIKSKYPELNQKMSARFYDSARFFSENMLFSRFEDSEIVQNQLFPAFAEYLTAYIKMIKNSQQISHPSFRKSVLDRHTAYDQYNAERDPAHGLFVQYFGDNWSERFMDEYLFELSCRPEGGYPKHPQQQQQQSS